MLEKTFGKKLSLGGPITRRSVWYPSTRGVKIQRELCFSEIFKLLNSTTDLCQNHTPDEDEFYECLFYFKEVNHLKKRELHKILIQRICEFLWKRSSGISDEGEIVIMPNHYEDWMERGKDHSLVLVKKGYKKKRFVSGTELQAQMK